MTTRNPHIGDTIEVYWPDDDVFYRGHVTAQCASTSSYRVEYVDGDVELLDLRKERWRIVPAGVKTAYLGTILYNATDVLPSPPSPVSVVLQSHCALTIIAHVANKWLNDETHRPDEPVAPEMIAQWTSTCADLCVQFVHGYLCALPVDTEHIDRDFTRWIRKCCDEDASQSVRLNTKQWKRALSSYEWKIEIHILLAVQRRFSFAKEALKMVDGRNVRYDAKSIAETAARQCFVKLE